MKSEIRASASAGVIYFHGDFLMSVLRRGKLVAAASSVEEGCLALLEKANAAEQELITLFYGQDITHADANRIADTIRNRAVEQCRNSVDRERNRNDGADLRLVPPIGFGQGLVGKGEIVATHVHRGVRDAERQPVDAPAPLECSTVDGTT